MLLIILALQPVSVVSGGGGGGVGFGSSLAIGVHLLVASGFGFGRDGERSGPNGEEYENPKAHREDQQNADGGETLGGAALSLQIFNRVKNKVDPQDAFI